MEPRTTEIHSLEDMEREAQFLVEALAQGTKATLVTLSGELGAGKTTFTQLVAKAFGITDTVNSPTFVIQKVYGIPGTKFTRLVHIDAYRLNGSSELDVLGFEELLQHPETLILLEWPERVPEVVETYATIRITLEVLASGVRRITYA